MAERDIFQSPDGNFIEFLSKEMKNEVLSAKEGRPIYETQHWVKVWAAGAKDKPEFRMDKIRAERYHEQYETWKRRIENGETGIIGTPLTQWPMIDRALAAGLRDQGILSVEMLAAIKDSDLHRFGPGIRNLRTQAQGFVEAAKGQAPVTKLTRELEEAREQIRTLQAQMTEVNALAVAKGIDPNAAQSQTAAPIDIQALVAAEVAKLAAAQPKKNGGWPKGKARKRREAPAETQTAA